MNYTVYAHISPNNKVYIGITCQKPEHRWNNGRGYIRNKYFYNAILKYGWDNFKHIIIADNMDKTNACSLEKMLIDICNSTNPKFGYNQSIGGNVPWNYGKHLKKETKIKISKSKKGTLAGELNPFYNKHHTEETKQKISETHKGKTSHKKGIPMKEEIKKKLSLPIICVETNICYFGINEAERQTGISNQNISKCLKGKGKTAGGFHWRYK